MMGTATMLRSVRWVRILPILAVAVTSFLMILAAKQDQEFWAAHAHFSDTPWEFQAPARLFAQLLNGPSFYLRFWAGGFDAFGLYFEDVGRLFGVVLFWVWVGWALDRRIRGTCTPFVRSRLLRGTLYAAMLVLTCLFVWAILDFLDSHMLLPSRQGWRYFVSIRLRSSALGAYAMLPWTAAFIFYFGRKLVATINSSDLPEKEAPSINRS